MYSRRFRSKTSLALGYAMSGVLVLAYVNMFPLWSFLSSRWEREVFIFLPVVLCIAGIATVSIIFFYRQRKTRLSVNTITLGIGILFCTLALIIPDPQFPVKRIHVAEYLLLSLVVRFAMSYSLRGIPLLFFSAGFAAVLGIHDELLQGLHPSRTYGLRDMTVNMLASCGGAIIWHACSFFSCESSFPQIKAETGKNISALYVASLITSILAFILPLVLYRGSSLPYWPAMPLIGTTVHFSLYVDQFTMSWKHGVGALSAVSFALILYPMISNVNALSFY